MRRNITKSVVKATLMTSMALTMQSCAQIDAALTTALENTIGVPLQYIEDSIRGYRVDYVSSPPGAKIVCQGNEVGVTPFKKWYDLTPEQKESQQFNLDECHAYWQSGASLDISTVVPLDQYPRNIFLVADRPADYPFETSDEEYGRAVVAHKQAQLQQAASALVGLGMTAYQVHKTVNATSVSSDFKTSAPVFTGVQDSRGIKWNWIQPTVDSPVNFGMPQNLSGSNSYTTLIPATRCHGAIVQGACHGAVIPKGIDAVCAGNFVNGRCLGPVLF